MAETVTAAQLRDRLRSGGEIAIVDAREEAKVFEARMRQYHNLRGENPDILAGIWHEEIGKLFAQLKAEGRIDLLDNHLAGDELNITIFPPQPRK